MPRRNSAVQFRNTRNGSKKRPRSAVHSQARSTRPGSDSRDFYD